VNVNVLVNVPAPVAAAVALAALSCAPLPTRPERPRVSVRAADVALASDGGLTLRLELDLANPNPAALTLRALDWEISVDDRPLARGRARAAATLAPRASTPATVEARVPPGAAARLIALRERGTPLRVDGVLHFFSPGGDVAQALEWVSPPASAPR
jgi:hypothetical protein